MSAYENVVGGKLKLKGKALDVKAGGVKKKKKKQKKHDHDHDHDSQVTENEITEGQGTEEATLPNEEDIDNEGKISEEGKAASYDEHLTPAEKRYIEQREQIDLYRMAKEADKSHRDRIQDFNQYLANMSEHYDIPKVGPG